MRILFYVNEKRKWERRLFEVLNDSAGKHGITLIKDTSGYMGVREDVGGVIVIGIGKNKRQCRQAYARAGKKVLYIDKGYFRNGKGFIPGKRTSHWRIIVGADHPTAYLNQVKRPADRWELLGLEMMPRREPGQAIMIAGSSDRYSGHNLISKPNTYAQWIIDELRRRGIDNKIIYRPKPGWKGAEPIPGTIYSFAEMPIEREMDRSKVVITHGSNAALDSIMHGLPVIILGTSIASPLTANTLDDMDNLDFPTDEQRYQWACNVAYCQWTPDEIHQGMAWETLKEQLK